MNWTINRRFATLFCIWIFTYFMSALFYAVLYDNFHGMVVTPDGKPIIWFGQALHFSLTTLSTLGYGDCVPVGVGRWIAHGEALNGLVLNGIAFSAIASKVINSPPALEFPDTAMYNPEVHRFWFRYINVESFDIYDTAVTVTLRRPLYGSTADEYDTSNYRLGSPNHVEDAVPPLRVMAIKTHSNNGEHTNLGPMETFLERPSPWHLLPTHADSKYKPVIAVSVTGSPRGSTSRFTSTKIYGLDRIRCGVTSGVDNPEVASASVHQKRAYLEAKLADFKESTMSDCYVCRFQSLCPLKPDARTRRIKTLWSTNYMSSDLIYQTIQENWRVNLPPTPPAGPRKPQPR